MKIVRRLNLRKSQSQVCNRKWERKTEKTTAAVNFAPSIENVQFHDCDFEEPYCHYLDTQYQ